MGMTAVLPIQAVDVVGQTCTGQKVGDIAPLNFSLKAGEIGGILYSRDAILLFQLILGMGELKQGTIHLNGIPLVASNGSHPIAWRQLIGFANCRKGLLSNLSLLDNVNLPAKYHGYYLNGQGQEEVAAKELARLEVPSNLWGKRPSEVSGFIRKRVILARSVVLDPEILLLDSPSELFSWQHLPLLGRWILHQKEHGRGVLIGSDNVPFLLALNDWLIITPAGEMDYKFKHHVDSKWLEGADVMRRSLQNEE
ncbi:MAG: ATP-binding cassette domain-containing protein [Bdellovibrionales bacterium]|jgi:ABC-type sugar transport system ATPase subunit|nr:ATP-binding cassette domain-containing protein [Bdellovibrionales bacterium]MBT3525441.1 ATP-binding cassette domain-containing protein [Bdellovibrionales bacterium]MBT7669808.1 ATP-binding cassette domain-containing protein [Bdellovibrionales bacterium]MBT7767046.1 ATP-binding cassette domain-containing protein [Bdellovibrionales bacterium]